MGKKHWIMIKRGLSEDARHRRRMGELIWIYIHIIDRASWNDGIVYEWKDKDEAEEMELEPRTLRYQRKRLEQLGYITCKRNRYSQDIVIHNWIDPRNYSGKIMNRRDVFKSDNWVASLKIQSDNQSDNGPEGKMQSTLDQVIRLSGDHMGAVKAPRPRDLLFDAIAEVCGIDPATAGSSIAKVESALKKSTPPYTPEEVKAFGVKWWEWKDRTTPPTIWKLKEQIGIVRQNGKSSNGHSAEPSSPMLRAIARSEGKIK